MSKLSKLFSLQREKESASKTEFLLFLSYISIFLFFISPSTQSTGRWNLVPNGGIWFRPRMRLEDALYCS